MKPEKWQQVERIFHDALEVNSSGRAVFVAENCGSDLELLREVESLLAADAPNTGFLEASAIEIHSHQNGDSLDSRIGEIFGHYKIIEKIGAGGMGAIYLAKRSDEEFEKRVAIKIIKRGMDTDAILHRFRNERQILAALEHPNISRLLDGGTTDDGLPYLVMEFVEGVTIDEYCRTNNLSETEQLALFRKVCGAVTFAHQKLIVHRDLKPSNILVNTDGEPKLLDFGIARLLDTTDDVTRTEARVLTPAYASPEQIRGEIVGTSSDVYSLGVILNELLTAQKTSRIVENKPLKSEKNVVKSVKRTNANNSLTMLHSKILRGDLQNIISMATHEDAARRYGSAEIFSEDIRRFLVGLPVLARKDTFIYRSRKFLSRHRVGVSALALIFLLLIGGIFAVWRQANIAEREREKAERRAENLRKLSSSFVVELHDAILNLPGSLAARQLLLTRAVEQLDALAAESEGNPNLQNELAQGYYNLSELPNINLSDVEQNTGKGVDIYRKLLVDAPQNIVFRKQLAKGCTLQANLQKVRGNAAGALSLLQQAGTILEAVVADEPSIEHRQLLLDVEDETAGILLLMGRARESLAISLREQVSGEEIINTNAEIDDFERMTRRLHFNECKSLTYLGEYQNSLELLRADLNIVTAEAATHPNDTRFRYQLWAYNRSLALTLERSGDSKNALTNLQTALELIEGLWKLSPDDVGHQRNTSFTHFALGQLLIRLNQTEKAIGHLRQSLEMSEKIFAKDPQKGETLEDLARIHSGLGNALVLLGKRDDGLKYLHESLQFYKKALERDSENASFRRDFAETLTLTGGVLQSSLNPNDRSEAKDDFTRSLEIWEDMQNKGILSFADAEQPKSAAQTLEKLAAVAPK